MQKKHFFYSICLVLLTIFAISCKNESITLNIDRGENYFPLQKGKYWEYTVDSVSYKVRNRTTHVVDSFHHTFQVRELVGDSLRDAAGRPSFRLERYTRPNSDSTWRLEDIWYVTKTSTTAERVEEDQRFVKLAFPVNKATKWNCVQYIDPYTQLSIWGERTEAAYSTDKGFIGYKDSIYLRIDKPYALNGRTYDSTATVLFADSDPKNVGGTNYRYYKEIYARNVGLVYKKLAIIDTQCFGSGCPRGNLSWAARAEVGFFLTMKLDRYGQQ